MAFSFDASRDQVFKAFPAIANLADKSSTGKVKLNIEAHSDEGFDAIWLRNAVMEPLSEAELLDDDWPGPANGSTSISAD